MSKVPESVVQTPEGGWRIAGSRVSLDSVVLAYRDGETPEAIVGDFPTLSLAKVHAALAFYLEHREEVDHYLTAQAGRWEQLRQESESAHGPLLGRVRRARDSGASEEGKP